MNLKKENIENIFFDPYEELFESYYENIFTIGGEEINENESK
ncbi:hypothetical protein OF820_07410 [Oceanotoga sp. DSM 15011]|jgi:hypothetical protein|nr:hypothetical protein [Oceanotoga sp. DSM 15011]UYO98901.1 hypothetical protein OF820_07410 [Oceanotoga sp. DSM 15011]